MTDYTPFDTYDRYTAPEGPLNQMRLDYGISNGNGQSDFNAIAHALTSAGLQYNWGFTATTVLGELRELTNSGSTPQDSVRDRYNNQIGAQISFYADDNNLPEEALEALVNDALNRGLLVVNENIDSRIKDLPYLFEVKEEYAFYGPSPELAALLEARYGLAPGTLPVDERIGEGFRTHFLAPFTSIRPMPRPATPTNECFPADTLVATAYSGMVPIRSLQIGDLVLAFDPHSENGRGALSPRRVTKLFRNTTTEWVKLTWIEDGEKKELFATPNHTFLDRFGTFKTIAEMASNGRTTLVLESNKLVNVVTERIVYSFNTVNMFERAQLQGIVVGSAILQPFEMDAW
jgi:hypothetical protein